MKRANQQNTMIRATGMGSVIAFAAVTASPHLAQAQDAPPTVQDAKAERVADNKTYAAEDAEGKGRTEGWDPGIAVGLGFNLVDAQNVVGQQNGSTITLIGGLDAAAPFNSGLHEWRNNLLASAGATQTPSLGEFVKTADGLGIESVYLLHLLEEAGPFARVAMNTQMFPSLDIRTEATTYAVTNLDGTTDTYTGRRLALTEAFQPLTFKESLGGFWQPLRSDAVSFEARGGLGAQETIAQGALVINDNDATPAIDVSEIDDSWLMGGEVVANVWGFFDKEKRIAFSAGLGVLIPFASSDLPAGDTRSVVDLTTLEGLAALNVKLFDWASLGYKLTVLRQPLVVDQVQVTNNLLITISGAFGSKAPAPPPPPPPCECPAPAPEPAKPAAEVPEGVTESPTAGAPEPAALPEPPAAEPEPAPEEPTPEPTEEEPAP